MIDNIVRYHRVTKEMVDVLEEGRGVILDNQRGWRRLFKIDTNYTISEDGTFNEEPHVVEVDLTNTVCPPEYLMNALIVKTEGYAIPMKCGHNANWQGYSMVGCKLCGFGEDGLRTNNENAFEVDWDKLEVRIEGVSQGKKAI